MKRLLFALLLVPTLALAEASSFEINIKDHRFSPAELKVPTGQKIKLVVRNLDSTPEEFESHSLNREKVILANASATIYIGPLSPGRYEFVGEFNEKTARGVIVAE